MAVGVWLTFSKNRGGDQRSSRPLHFKVDEEVLNAIVGATAHVEGGGDVRVSGKPFEGNRFGLEVWHDDCEL